MSRQGAGEPIEILLVEDNPGDVRLTQEILKEGKVRNNLAVVGDGDEALVYLRKKGRHSAAARPDLILLDLNLPGRDGQEVLTEIKEDSDLRRIPVIVISTSEAEQDILRSYDSHANSYLTKPVDLDQFIGVVRAVEDFWLTVVKLPPS